MGGGVARRNDPQLADNWRKFQAELKRFTDLNEVIWRRPCPTPVCAGGVRFRPRQFGFRLSETGGGMAPVARAGAGKEGARCRVHHAHESAGQLAGAIAAARGGDGEGAAHHRSTVPSEKPARSRARVPVAHSCRTVVHGQTCDFEEIKARQQAIQTIERDVRQLADMARVSVRRLLFLSPLFVSRWGCLSSRHGSLGHV